MQEDNGNLRQSNQSFVSELQEEKRRLVSINEQLHQKEHLLEQTQAQLASILLANDQQTQKLQKTYEDNLSQEKNKA